MNDLDFDPSIREVVALVRERKMQGMRSMACKKTYRANPHRWPTSMMNDAQRSMVDEWERDQR